MCSEASPSEHQIDDALPPGPCPVGEVKLDEDATEFAWVTLEEAKNYDLIDGIWDEIREVEEILHSRK